MFGKQRGARRPGRVSGGEPATARSALGLRTVLAWAAVGAGAVGALVLLLLGRPPGEDSGVWVFGMVVCAVVVVAAAIDLVVIARRRRERRR